MKIRVSQLRKLIAEATGRKMSPGVATIVKKLDSGELSEFEVSVILRSAQNASKQKQAKALAPAASLDELQSKADELMTSVGYSDRDTNGAEFRAQLESLFKSSTPGKRGQAATTIDDVMTHINKCSKLNDQIRSELDDNGGDEYDEDVQELQNESDSHHVEAMDMIQKLFKMSATGGR